LGAGIGAVVGLVAITPAAGYVTVPQSIFFGFITAIVSNKVLYSKAMQKIDDTLDVLACHGIGGIMGMILTAIFAQGENASLMHSGWNIFAHHTMVLVLVSVFTFAGSLLLFKVTNLFIPLRVSEESEQLGLDISQHDERIESLEPLQLEI
jgi:Amt family ammonium transporter